ncbi:MAG: nucleoside triphosphate pyrophosphohydrolase [Acidobacteria bacterium]|nr:nucleoside triphosphate pyrophosphohydrolase [Acidobacteriota bacterium]MCA1642677.1 nucleoside triphosphate pyrophosphohydrolase [Acidobacteriota bacterium]
MPVTFSDLVALMARLRSPEGCPWDREQTYATLAPMLLEEAYEAFEAVEEAREGRPAALRDELGDLLFQIIFYAQVAGERKDFTIEEVVDAIHTKMVRRHPHVFADAKADDTAEVLRNWEAIKAEEKRAAGKAGPDEDSSLLDGVSAKAPALMEAHQLTTKAARVGFDWQRVEDIFDKLHEEIDELKAAISERDAGSRSGASEPTGVGASEQLRRESPSRPASGDEAVHEHVREELGDLLFAVTNIARHLGVEPEAALKLTNRKFRRRFRHIERGLRARGGGLDGATLEEMEELWQEAKKT